MEFTDFDAELADWSQLQTTHPCSGLLLGNGASLAVWKNFAYDSLFELAQTTRNKPLSPTELALFKSMETENFEPVLSGLKVAMRVNAALTISSSSPRNRYFAIKEALIHGIRSAHIPWRLMKACWKADVHNITRYDCLQPKYNLFLRKEYERELAELCADQNIAVIPYSPLAAGFATGKYTRENRTPESQRGSGWVTELTNTPEAFDALDILREIATEKNVPVGQIAIAWLLHQPTVTSPILGARTLEQFTEMVGAVEVNLSADELERLNEATKNF